MASQKRLYLIDGMALIYRAHFALIKQPLLTSDGRHTSAIFGFMNMMERLIREKSPEMLAIVLDSKQPTFRHEVYTEYKATREKMPEELSEQIEPLLEVIKATKIPIIQYPGYEADDIIGTLAKQADQDGLRTYIVSGDKDLMQLITDNVFMFTPGSRWKPDTVYDHKAVVEKWGVPPDKIIDFLALTGDTSDNIPGIRGIGPKTAKKLIDKFKNLDSVLDKAKEIENEKLRDKIIHNKDMALLSKELVTIDLDVPVEFHIQDFERQPMDTQKLTELLQNLELTSILNKIDKFSGASIMDEKEKVKKLYTTILTKSDLNILCDHLLCSTMISFDTETTSIDPHRAEIVGMSFSTESDIGWYIPIQFPENDKTTELNLEEVLNKLRPLFEDDSIKICGQNIKYDALVMLRYGIQLNGIIFDTMIAAHLIRPDLSTLKLDTLSQLYLSYRMRPIEDLIGNGSNQKTMDKVPLDEISFYATEDADVAFQLTEKLGKSLKDEDLDFPFNEVEIPLIPVLIKIESNGVYLDLKFLSKLSADFGQKMEDIKDKIYTVSGREFNINSPKQLGEILFDDLGLKTVRKRSTDVNVLAVLQNYHPLPKFVLDYRKYKKLTSTYIDAFPNYVHPDTGRIHTSLNQTIAATGRLSSTRPNFQNIPIRTELGREIRKAFTAQKNGWQICSMDYSQIELRIMAHLANESTLIEAFRNEEDIHARTAALVYNIPVDEVTVDQRRSAKVVNFGIMYGAGPYRMSQELNISMGDAKELINTYFNTYPGIRKFIDTTIVNAKRNGYVSTLMGRKRKTPNLRSKRQQIVQAEERAAINMPIQGTAAELIKIAMINIHKEMINRSMKSKMILQIHDELLFEVPELEIDDLTKMVIQKMETAMKLSVPLKVETGIGNNWFDAH